MGRILVGISSWTEPTLIKHGGFYPRRADSAEDRLRYYASQFPIVEVDSTYYSPPSERNSMLWVERTPPHFKFNIKAYSLFTNHPTRVDALYKEVRDALPRTTRGANSIYRDHVPPKLVDEVWERFRTALLPLHAAGKLGACLFQFPHWFVISSSAKEYLVECKQRLPEFQLAIEFRHKSWMEASNRDETLEFLSRHELPYVAVDEPQGFDSSVPPTSAVTTKQLGMVRFHGRNAEVWEKKTKTAAERFRYLYSDEELAEWKSGIERMARETEETHVIMNNCYADYAVRNARQVANLVSAF